MRVLSRGSVRVLDALQVDREHLDAWRRLTLVPIAALVGAVLVLLVTGWAIDASDLEQRQDSWGFVAGTVILAFVALGPAGLTLAAAALARSFDAAWVSVVGACWRLARRSRQRESTASAASS